MIGRLKNLTEPSTSFPFEKVVVVNGPPRLSQGVDCHLLFTHDPETSIETQLDHRDRVFVWELLSRKINARQDSR